MFTPNQGLAIAQAATITVAVDRGLGQRSKRLTDLQLHGMSRASCFSTIYSHFICLADYAN
jgi:hypothetical protein